MDMLSSASTSHYAACDHIKKKPPDIDIDDEIVRSFTTECDVLPLFEKRIFDFTRMKHYSLKSNEAFRCCWREFLRQLEGRQRMPFQFPSANDFHFYKYHTRYEPSQSHANRAELKLINFGQGGETRGYAPVPNEMHTRKTFNVKKPRTVTKKLKKRVLRH